MEQPRVQPGQSASPSASSTLRPTDVVEVDQTLIRELRRLTPEERLNWHMRMVRLVLEMRDGLRR